MADATNTHFRKEVLNVLGLYLKWKKAHLSFPAEVVDIMGLRKIIKTYTMLTCLQIIFNWPHLHWLDPIWFNIKVDWFSNALLRWKCLSTYKGLRCFITLSIVPLYVSIIYEWLIHFHALLAVWSPDFVFVFIFCHMISVISFILLLFLVLCCCAHYNEMILLTVFLSSWNISKMNTTQENVFWKECDKEETCYSSPWVQCSMIQ